MPRHKLAKVLQRVGRIIAIVVIATSTKKTSDNVSKQFVLLNDSRADKCLRKQLEDTVVDMLNIT